MELLVNKFGEVGIRPVRQTLIGMVGRAEPGVGADWALRMEDMGREGK